MKQLKVKLFLLGIAFLVVATHTQADTMSFEFSQNGFADGATVTGFIIAEDMNGDDSFYSYQGEVLSFGIEFSGNSLVPAFSFDHSAGYIFFHRYSYHGIGDFYDFVGAGDGDKKWSGWDRPFGYGGEVSSGGTNGSVVCSTSYSPFIINQVAPVPEPATMLLFGLGLLGFAGVSRKKN